MAYEAEDYLGEIMIDLDENTECMMIKRRIYTPYYTVNFNGYTGELVTSLFYEIKHYYLNNGVYRSYDSEIEIASIFAFISVFEPIVKKSAFLDH